MKKVLTFAVLLFAFLSSFSQITLSSSDMPIAGTSQRTIKDTLPLPVISFGSKGINQVYDFSNLTGVVPDTIEYRTPTVNQLSNIPNSDVATTTDGVNFLFTKTTASKFIFQGLEGKLAPTGNVIPAAFTTAPDIFQFPLTYGTNFSGTALLTKTVPGTDVGQPGIYQVRFTLTTTSIKDTVDGWGKVVTPVGAYKGLRNKRVETTNTLIEYKLLAFSNWATLSNTTATTTRYTYLTKETKGSALTFDYDSANNVTGVTYSLNPPAAPIADFGSISGGGGLVFFTDSTDGYPDTYDWNFGDGSTNGTTQNPNHTYAANGAYYVCLTVTNAGGTNTFCDSVHVTGISAANNPPVAVTDTVTLLQASSITIFHVAANDIDPDGDNVCMTAVWGSPYVTEQIGGSCDMVSITPDSTFVGTDTAYYSICDNGTPVLCDTGMIIFTVLPDPALLPVSAFSTAPFTYGNCTGSLTTSTSVNASSLAWNFHPFNPVQPDSAYTSSAVLYYGDMSSTINLSVQVCLSATNQFGTSTKCDTVDLSCTTSVNELTENNSLLFPNPVTNVLTIRTTNDFETIEIYNALGEKMKIVTRTSGNMVTIPVSELADGVYIATIVDLNGTRKTLGNFTKN